MRTHVVLFLLALSLVVSSCGIQKQVVSSKTTNSYVDNTDDNIRVQHTFFGAKFGDKGQYEVKNTMTSNGIGYLWKSLGKNQWGIFSVEFASEIWTLAGVAFIDNRFSTIMFIKQEEDKEKSQVFFTKMYELLSNKYPLKKDLHRSHNENFYLYVDDDLNLVGINHEFSEDMNSWVVTLMYSWGKSDGIKHSKAIKEI